jgi:hypothetical protein
MPWRWWKPANSSRPTRSRRRSRRRSPTSAEPSAWARSGSTRVPPIYSASVSRKASRRGSETRRFGALTLRVAGRTDQIHFKLYAAVDQGLESKHAADLRVLEPTRDELLAAARWSRTHDPSEGYKLGLVHVLTAFGVEDADAVV